LLCSNLIRLNKLSSRTTAKKKLSDKVQIICQPQLLPQELPKISKKHKRFPLPSKISNKNQ